MRIDFLPIFTPKIAVANRYEKSKFLGDKDLELPNVYYLPLSFTSLKPIGEELKLLDNVHCPCCGIEMLTEDKVDELMSNVENIQTSKQFVEYLGQNNSHISRIFKSLISNLNNIVENNPDIELLHLLNIARSSSTKHVKNIMNSNIQYLNSIIYAEKYLEKDLAFVQDCRNGLSDLLNSDKKIIPYDSYLNILRTTILNMEHPDKYVIYGELQKIAAKAFMVRNALYISNIYSKEDSTPAYAVIRNIYNLSMPQTRPVVKTPPKYEHENNVFNEIALCRKCSSDNSFSKLLSRSNEPHIRDNYNKYLEDIADTILKGRLEGYERYPQILRGMLRIHNSDKSDYIFSDVAFELKQRIFEMGNEINQELPFIDDIPCACCGKDTISHSQKLELFEEIEKAKNNWTLYRIMERKPELIRDKYIPIVEDFKGQMNKPFKVPSDKILEIMKERAAKRLERKIFDCAEKLKYATKKDNLSESDYQKIDEFIMLLEMKYRNYDPNKQFIFAEYNNIIDATLGKLEYPKKHNYIFRMKKPVKKMVIAQQSLFPLDRTLEKFDNPLKLVMQDILKGACATKDHIVARQRGGGDDRSNLMILCKDCNKDKTNNAFGDWHNKNPELSVNMQKQVDFIKTKIKTGEVDAGMQEYLEELSANIQELSNGTIYLKV